MSAPSAQEILKLQNLSIGYGRINVLQDVSLTVSTGEFWFLLGPNGEGKSTLVKAILGLLKPQSGSITRSPECGCLNKMGFVPQRCDLNPTLPTTVREFVLSGLAGIKASKQEQMSRLASALKHVELCEMERKSYWSLSGGQRQRALLARALIRKPALLIADEPTNGLDPSAENALMKSLVNLNKTANLTILFVTHDLALAAHHATHAALFHSGRVQAGVRAETLTSEKLRQTFGFGISIEQEIAGTAAVRIGGIAPRD